MGGTRGGSAVVGLDLEVFPFGGVVVEAWEGRGGHGGGLGWGGWLMRAGVAESKR